jgi:TPR repeat protein
MSWEGPEGKCGVGKCCASLASPKFTLEFLFFRLYSIAPRSKIPKDMKPTFIALLALFLSLPLVAADKDKPLPKDFKSLKALAEKGDARAQLQIGHVYRRGEGVRKDPGSAAKWYTIAAKKGSPEASYYLGVAYFNGSGVEWDLVRAYVNLSVAAKAKDARAIRVKEAAAKAMTPKQIATGDSLLQDLKRQTHFKFQPDCFAALVKTVGLDWVKENHVKFRPEAPKGEIIDFVDSEIGLRASWASVKLKNGDEIYISSAAGIAISDGKIALFAKQIYRANTLEATKAAIKLHQNQAMGYQTPVRMTDFLLIVFTQTALESDTREQFLKRIKAAANKDKPLPEWVELTKTLAEKGDLISQFGLGVMYESGQQVEQDLKEAFKWYRKAAEQGLSNAQFKIGAMYLAGEGVGQNQKEAVQWLGKAAEQGQPKAQNMLGAMYGKGEGVGQDDKEAVKWFRKAAMQGNKEAQFNLGESYEKGRGVQQDDKEAGEWYQKAADQGVANAQCQLGRMLSQGRGVIKDEGKALKWYQKAADQGHLEAQTNLGAMYEYGNGVKKDGKKAFQLYRKAAERGHAKAQTLLGVLLLNGKEVEKDNKEGAKWINKAAEQGYPMPQSVLGLIYENGLGVTEDFVIAYAWYEIAAVNGSADGRAGKGRIVKGMTPDQIAEGQKLSREMVKKNPKLLKTPAANKAKRGLSPEEEKLVGAYIYIGRGKAYPKGGTTFKKVLRADGVYEKWTDDKKSSVEFKWVIKNGELLVSSSAFTTIYKIGSNGDIAKIAEIINGRRMTDPSGPGSTYKRVKTVAANQNPKPLPSEIERTKRLAENGDPASQYSLGLRYYQGKGVKRDSVTAYAWWEIAASNGNKAASKAKRILALELTDQQVEAGRKLSEKLTKESEILRPGEDLDLELMALIWLHVAFGDGFSQYSLGLRYYKGDGVGKSAVTAYALWDIAAERGNKAAEKDRRTLARELTDQQIGKAKDFALILKNNIPKQPQGKQLAKVVKTLKEFAEKGDANSQFLLSAVYMFGVGAQKDPKKAAEWLTKASDRGHARAQTSLGALYYSGIGVGIVSFKEAVKLFRKSAQQGDLKGQMWLGMMYANGEGVPKDVQEAMKWWRKAAAQGNPESQYSLGWKYFIGIEIRQDYVTAYAWWKIAEANGNKEAGGRKLDLIEKMLPAQITKAEALAKEMVKKNPKLLKVAAGKDKPLPKEFKSLKALAEKGDVDAQYKLGMMCYNGDGVEQDFKEAFKWLKKAVDQGHARAQNSLGFMYDRGQGVPKDFKVAVKWFQKAADQGYAEGQDNLGLMYGSGRGVEQDFKEAFKWFQKAADQGYAKAQYNLGLMYANDQGGAQDFKEAVKWYQKAAEQGHANAQYNLGAMYANGQGVAQNYITAYAWASIAITNGEKKMAPRSKSEFLEPKMTPAQIVEAEELVKEMIKKNPKLLNK